MISESVGTAIGRPFTVYDLLPVGAMSSSPANEVCFPQEKQRQCRYCP